VGRSIVKTLLAHRRQTPLYEGLDRLETLVSPYTGIVRGAQTLLVQPVEAPLIKVTATMSAIEASAGLLDETSGGYAPASDRARAAALGEAAERYAGALPLAVESKPLPAHEVAAAVDPARFALFAPEQHREGFPFRPFEATTAVRWVEGFSLDDGAPALVPSQLVRLAHRRSSDDEVSIGYSTSSGLACGSSLEEAVLAAFLELVERDAFMLAWNQRLRLPLLDWSDDDSLRRFEDRYVAPTGAKCHVVDLSVFLDVPAAVAVVLGDGTQTPAVAVGGGAGSTVHVAIEKAIAEAFAVRSWGLHMLATEPVPTFKAGFDDVVTFRDHIRFYLTRDHAEAAAFLVESSERRPVADVAALTGTGVLDQIRAIVERLRRQDVSAYAVDVTPIDLAAAGLSVAKAVAPELCPLDSRHDARFLGGSRLRDLPAHLGLAKRALRWDDINPFPHPFP
jgi:ribosomal protein S12 methylthiotransferase accessory factor